MQSSVKNVAWSTSVSPAWAKDPAGPKSWDSVPANPLAKAPPPTRAECEWDGIVPGPPGVVSVSMDEKMGKDWAIVEMAKIRARRAGQAEQLVKKVEPRTTEPPLSGVGSKSSLKRQRQAAARAAVKNTPVYVSTGQPASSGGPTMQKGCMFGSASDGDESVDEEAEVLTRKLMDLKESKARKAAALAAADPEDVAMIAQLAVAMAKQKAKVQRELGLLDTDAGAGEAAVPRVGPNQFVCVGPARETKADLVGALAGKEMEAEVPHDNPNQFVCVGLKCETDAAANRKQGKHIAIVLDPSRFNTSGRKVLEGRNMDAAKGRGKGERGGYTSDPEEDTEGPRLPRFWPDRHLSDEEQLAQQKVMSCCGCGVGPLRQSDLVLWNDGRSASWQGKIFGWCISCMELEPKEFKSAMRRTWGHRAQETVGLRDRAMFMTFKNAAATIRADFPDDCNADIRELVVKRHRMLCISYAAAIAKDNEFLAEARASVQATWLENTQRQAEDPTFAPSVDGQVLTAQDCSYLTSMADGIELCFVCRNGDCSFFGMNSTWMQFGQQYKFRCPCCFDPYSTTSTTKGQVEYSYVLSVTDFETGDKVLLPALWPESKDQKWLNGQIEAYSLRLMDEVGLAAYKNRGPAELHTLLAQEAIPTSFVKMPIGCTPGSDENRVWNPLWNLAGFKKTGFVWGNKLSKAQSEQPPFNEWNDFIAICGRIVAEGKSAAQVAGLMSK